MLPCLAWPWRGIGLARAWPWPGQAMAKRRLRWSQWRGPGIPRVPGPHGPGCSQLLCTLVLPATGNPKSWKRKRRTRSKHTKWDGHRAFISNGGLIGDKNDDWISHPGFLGSLGTPATPLGGPRDPMGCLGFSRDSLGRLGIPWAPLGGPQNPRVPWLQWNHAVHRFHGFRFLLFTNY